MTGRRDFRSTRPTTRSSSQPRPPTCPELCSINSRWVLVLNPMAGVVEGFRWALLGTGPSPGAMLGVSVGLVLLLLIAGLHYFRRMEKTFADIV